MAKIANLDFQAFVVGRHEKELGRADGRTHAYAYVSDQNTRAVFERAKAVELAVAAGVRAFKQVGKAQLLGHSVKIGPRQFPRVHALTRSAADKLGIAPPTVYVVNNPHLNAATYGTNDDAFVLVHSALIDHLSDEELLSVIGHECGHIHNDHVVYLTALHYLSHMAGLVVKSVGLPAMVALRGWSRRAEITCDRAGALCVGDVEISLRALTKLALGSHKLYDQLNVDAFLEQYEEAQQSVGRYGELLSTHPWLPKRVLALRIFSESALYRSATGRGQEGLTMEQVDAKVHDVVKVIG